MQELDLAAFRATPLNRRPFDYLIVPGFVRPEARAAVLADYPRIDSPGSYPLGQLTYGPAFAALVETLRGPDMRAAFAEKFGLDLEGRPTTVTVRGRCGTRDGFIHTDSVSKLITVLIYLNPAWEAEGGRLRLLRSAHDLDDVVAEVPPTEGALVAFRRSDNSYHGHKTFVGPRRVIQLNWVAGRHSALLSALRHGLSGLAKTALGWLAARPAAGWPRRTARGD
jgi:hypothetical protein